MAILSKPNKGNSPGQTTSAKIGEGLSFPEKELKEWLKGREHWNHDDWLKLLEDLRKKGFSAWTETEANKTLIGNFLEKNRKK